MGKAPSAFSAPCECSYLLTYLFNRSFVVLRVWCVNVYV